MPEETDDNLAPDPTTLAETGPTGGSTWRQDAPGSTAAARLAGSGGAPAEVIGDYEVLGKLGQGGMGAVYRARQRSLDRQIALKILPASLEADAEFVARFQREARIAASLNHANLVRVYASGQADGCHYIAMELIEGETLGDTLKRGPLPPAEALRITLDVARALDCGWQSAQLIHRDIKPGNIFLSSRGEVKLGDLGLAKTMSGDTTGLTQTGTMMGTPHYISPEQARGERDLDFRADIYSLGCTLYQMLTGRTPYEGRDPVSVMHQHIHGVPPAILKVMPQCPIPLARLVGKMLKKIKRERQASYADLLAEMERVAALFAPAAALAETARPHDPEATLLSGNPPPARASASASGAPASASSASPAKSKLALYCGIGALAVALMIGGVFFLLRRPEKLTAAQLYAQQRAAEKPAAVESTPPRALPPEKTEAAKPTNFPAAGFSTASPAPGSTGAGPPKERVRFGNSEYQIIQQSSLWTQAKSHAEQLGGHLATITSAEEHQWIVDTFIRKHIHTLWIGATRSGDGGWQWVNGEPFAFTAWMPGPDDDPQRNFAYLKKETVSPDGKVTAFWRKRNNTGEDVKPYFLAEWEVGAAAPPSTPVPARTLPASTEPWVDALADPAALALKGGATRLPGELKLVGQSEAVLVPLAGPDFAVRILAQRSRKLDARLRLRGPAGNNLYAVVFNAPNTVTVQRYTGSEVAVLQSFKTPRPVEIGARFDMEARIVGGKISVTFLGTLLGSVEDRTWSTGGASIFTAGDADAIVRAVEYLDLSKPAAAAAAAPGAAGVDLLRLVALPRDAVAGRWSLQPEGLALESRQGFGVCELPYEAPEEYDFEVEFTPTTGGNNANFYLSAGGSSFAYKLHAHGQDPPIHGLDLLDGKIMPARSEGVATSAQRIETGQRYTSRIEVRRGGLRGFVNGVAVFQWAGDYGRLSMEAGSKLRNPRHLGVGSYARAITFHRIAVRAIGASPPTAASAAPAAQSAAGSLSSASSPPGAVAFGGHRYLAVAARGISWAEAKARAEAMGGHLATVTSAAENDFVVAQARPLLPGANNMLWLGGIREKTGLDGWRWVTGEPFIFTAWGPGNPSSQGVGDWAVLMHTPAKIISWNDYETRAATPVNLDFYFRGFIVEWESL